MADYRNRCGLLVLLLLSGLLLTLPGCGFHLRGAYEAPPELMPVYISPTSSGVAREMRENLRGGGINLAEQPATAKTQIRLLDEQSSSRVLSVDGQGKVLENELRLQVKFDVLDAAGEELVPAQTVTVVRAQVNPDVEVLGKQEEAALLRQDMRQEIGGRILRRIQANLR